MPQFNITEAKTRFSELVRKAMTSEEIVIARDNQPLVKLVPIQPRRQKRTPGSGKGQILFMAADFDATPQGFEDYTG